MSCFFTNNIYYETEKDGRRTHMELTATAVSPSFPATMGISIIGGRDFREDDLNSSKDLCIFNRTAGDLYGISPGDIGNSLEVIANLVSADLGVAFVPAFGSESLSQSITRLPSRTPTCRRGIWLSYKALWQPSPQQEQFRTFLLHYFSGPAPDSSVVY